MAGEIKPFNQDAFTEAKVSGKTVLLDLHTDWCPVCRKQGLLLQTLVQEDKLKDVVVFMSRGVTKLSDIHLGFHWAAKLVGN